MSKYIFLYRGPATPMSDFTPEQQAEQMEAWGQWIGKLGSSLTDVGNPFGARTSLADDGTTRAPRRSLRASPDVGGRSRET